jgi:hypothetical protein
MKTVWSFANEAEFWDVIDEHGISKEEAIIIAQNNLIDTGGAGNCYIHKPKVRDSKTYPNCWMVEFSTTFRVKIKHGLEYYVFHIDKASGEIKSFSWGPDF